jgi:S-adenosylmethionine decarboxylase
MVLLDESHCSAHCYADTRQIAMDVFTCGSTSPWTVLTYIQELIDLGTVTVKEIPRFIADPRLEAPTHTAASKPVEDVARCTEWAL